jgi:inorganic pyrophosphatase
MESMIFDVVIEIPAGSRNKYEIDHETGEIRLDRMLFTSTRYPFDYGFVKNTLSNDGDPLDALVMLDEPTFPGCVVSCRVIGMYRMVDEAGGDDKLLCVAAGDVRKNPVRDLADVGQFELDEIQHFFQVYKALEPDKHVTGGEWVNHDEAQMEIINSYDRYQNH